MLAVLTLLPKNTVLNKKGYWQREGKIIDL